MQTTIDPTAVLSNPQVVSQPPAETMSTVIEPVPGQMDIVEATQEIPAELVEKAPEAVQSQNKATVVLSIEEALNAELDSFTQKKDAIKKKNKLIRDRLMLDPEYHDADTRVKKEQAERKLAKMKAISNDDGLTQLTNELRELRLDNKMHQMSIQDYLIALEKETGLTTFESTSGEIIEFEKVAKIKTKN